MSGEEESAQRAGSRGKTESKSVDSFSPSTSIPLERTDWLRTNQEDDPHGYELWLMEKYNAWESQDKARRESGEFGKSHYRSVAGMGMPDKE